MICPKCQTENPDGAKFCIECGQSLRLELVCPRCGHTNPKDSDFCEEYGHSLTEQRLKMAKELSQRSRTGVDMHLVAWGLSVLFIAFLEYE